jgi:uncharacterized protein with PIN domain
MRTLVEPPPSMLCIHCNGELQLKALIDSVEPALDLDEEIFVCAKCGREQSYTVRHDQYVPHLKTPGNSRRPSRTRAD